MSCEGRLTSSFFNNNGSTSANNINSNNNNAIPFRFDSFLDTDSTNQVLKENLAGLEWGEDLSPLSQELSSFTTNLRKGSTNGSSFLTDPIESISQNDEALGLEFTSCNKLPFVSTSTPAKLSSLISQNEYEFRENSSQQLENNSNMYLSSGFDSSGFGFNGNGASHPANERTFSSSSNSSNTSFISEGSFNNILRNSQENGYRDSSGYLSGSTPQRNETFARNEEFGSRYASRMDETFATAQNSCFQDPFQSELEPYKRWDLLDQDSCPTASTPQSRVFSKGDNWSRYGSGSPRNGSQLAGASNVGVADLSSMMESLGLSSDTSYKLSNSSKANSIWNTGAAAGNNIRQQNTAGPPQELSAKETLHCLQILKEIQDECNENGESARVAQTGALMKLLRAHLVKALDRPSSPEIPIEKFPRRNASTADATFTWSGQLPPRIHKNPTFSVKVFLGGVPWDITEGTLIHAFKPFGNVKIEWPKKEISTQQKGFAYVIFEHEKQVKMLLQNCTQDYSSNKAGKWYYKISTKKIKGKDVEVIPWAISESNFNLCQATKIDGKRTIFVGALHGMLNAEALATVMNDLFGGVAYAGIDTDRNKYPIGSGRVSFSNTKSYMKAVSAAFVEIITTKFSKKLQVDPYLEDSTCSICFLQQGPYFCREFSCFRYYCRTCYESQHASEPFSHRYLMRNANNKSHGGQALHQTNFGFSQGRNQGGNGWNNSTSQYQNGYNNGNSSSYNNNNHNHNQRRYESGNSRFSQMMR